MIFVSCILLHINGCLFGTISLSRPRLKSYHWNPFSRVRGLSEQANSVNPDNFRPFLGWRRAVCLTLCDFTISDSEIMREVARTNVIPICFMYNWCYYRKDSVYSAFNGSFLHPVTSANASKRASNQARKETTEYPYGKGIKRIGSKEKNRCIGWIPGAYQVHETSKKSVNPVRKPDYSPPLRWDCAKHPQKRLCFLGPTHQQYIPTKLLPIFWLYWKTKLNHKIVAQ